MSIKAHKLQELRTIIKSSMKKWDSDPGDPAEFLAEIVAGRDPRPLDTSLYELIKDLDAEDEMPSKDEWAIIKHMVLHTDKYKRERVSVEESTKAAMKLMEFLHPKQKSVEIEGTLHHEHKILPTLNKKEMKAFKKVFEDLF